jgi:predicted secreted protein
MEEKHGDEALKQVGLFCLMRWLEIHAGTLEEHQNNESWPEALHTMADLSNLSTSIRTIEQIGSFGGDDDWRQMLREIVTQAVMEQMEESGCIKNMFAQWHND